MNLCFEGNFDPVLEATVVVRVTNVQTLVTTVKRKPV